VDRLLANGEQVRVLVRRPGLFAHTPADVVHGDLATGEGLDRSLQGVDTVLHLAGVTKALSTADYYKGNATATENLARVIARTSAGDGRAIRMVHVSSLAATGPAQDATPITEDAAPHPVAHYGKSKLEGERLVREILPEAVIVRPPAVYGPRDTDVFEILKAVNQGIVTQIAGGERYFSAIYVDDLVDGILAAARAPQAAGRAYFLAHRAVASWSELIGIAAGIMGNRVRVLKVPAAAAYAAGYCAELWSQVTRKPGIVSRDKVSEMACTYWICDTRRAKDELAFEARTNIGEGLELTLAWYREAGWLKWK
jgi:nucleoside-diphosphate-sugar epimerase